MLSQELTIYFLPNGSPQHQTDDLISFSSLSVRAFQEQKDYKQNTR